MSSNSVDSSKPCIIIAAYNEASVIKDTLASLHTNGAINHYQLLVVCNGCTDETDSVIRTHFPHVLRFNLTHPSKALAIRYAESLNPGFPRIYLDADITLTALNAHTLIELAKSQKQPCLLIPSSDLISTHSTALVKSYYRTWYKTPHVQQSGFGAGTYVINKIGRDGFGEWPELIADDAFVRLQFASDHVNVTQKAKVAVKAPKTLWSLIKVKSRSKLGNLELNAYMSQNSSQQLESNSVNKPPQRIANSGVSEQSVTSISYKWYDKGVYLTINLVALMMAKWQFLTGYRTWQRDESNR